MLKFSRVKRYQKKEVAFMCNKKNFFLAFDVGGTTIKYAIINHALEIVEHASIATKQNENGHILKSIETISQNYREKYPLAAIGISTAGIVNSQDGSIKYANYLIPNYIGTPLKERLEEVMKIPVFVVNDVQAALLGEILQAKLPDKTFCLTLGTGIGGAYFQNQQVYHGAHDYENYIGALNYDPVSQTTWEQRASTIALEQRLAQSHQISVPEAFQKARTGDKEIYLILSEWIEEIAKGIANIILLLDPAVILVGGGVSRQNDFLLPILAEKLKLYLPESFLKAELKTPTSCNENALLGALYPFLINN